jgi:hypothetical protein
MVKMNVGKRLARVFQFPHGGIARVDVGLLPRPEGRAPLLPFRCYGCEQLFAGEPPTLSVRYAQAELRFCSDNCALDEGFAIAVEARFDAELAGEGSSDFVWVDERYDATEVA